MVRCPLCQQESLRIIAVITHGEVIRKLLRHLKRMADPPPMAPAHVRQEACLVLRLPAPGVSQTHPCALARRCHTALVWSGACDAPAPCQGGRYGRPASVSPQRVPLLPLGRIPRHGNVWNAHTLCSRLSRSSFSLYHRCINYSPSHRPHRRVCQRAASGS